MSKKNIEEIGKACVGCRSCEQVCPVQCIEFRTDEDGFLYPNIDEEKCVQCGKCLAHCPAKKENKKQYPISIYGVKNKNRERLLRSASGGASDLAAQYILAENGVVFGCAYEEKLKVGHIEVAKEKDLCQIQSSKYVQSNLKNCYTIVKERLDEGKKVLFTGTPCQIAGLYAFIGEGNKENLYTLDLICHGVPSPLFFEKYLKYQEDKLGEPIESYNFRSKEKRGWGTQYQIRTQNHVKQNKLSLDKYGKHFMAGDCYRECCYQCEYSCMERISDLTCGDFWGVEKSHPEFMDSSGVSVVLVNTKHGEQLLEKMSEFADIVKASVNEILPYQGNLVRPTKRTEKRDGFYKNINSPYFVKELKVGLHPKEWIKSLLPQKIILKVKSRLK